MLRCYRGGRPSGGDRRGRSRRFRTFGFQQHPRYGKLELPGDRDEHFDEVFPLVALPDVQGGKGRRAVFGGHFSGLPRAGR
jgi:hypothetical protein